jgi:uncharacterized OB-fold protein
MKDQPTVAQSPSFPRPLPKIDGVAAPYWRALREERIELPRCTACRRFHFPPRSFCPHCHGRAVAWEKVEAGGRLYTYTVVHKPTLPYFMAVAPYVYALVELDCGVRLPTMLVECRPEEIRVGGPVVPVFTKVSDEVTLLHFRPAQVL